MSVFNPGQGICRRETRKVDQRVQGSLSCSGTGKAWGAGRLGEAHGARFTALGHTASVTSRPFPEHTSLGPPREQREELGAVVWRAGVHRGSGERTLWRCSR